MPKKQLVNQGSNNSLHFSEPIITCCTSDISLVFRYLQKSYLLNAGPDIYVLLNFYHSLSFRSMLVQEWLLLWMCSGHWWWSAFILPPEIDQRTSVLKWKIDVDIPLHVSFIVPAAYRAWSCVPDIRFTLIQLCTYTCLSSATVHTIIFTHRPSVES